MAQRIDIQLGMVVKSKDGHQLGRVIGLLDDAFIVEKGVFYARDYRVPFRSVDTLQGDDVLLSLDRDQLQKASLGETLDAGHRMEELEPGRFAEARMDTAKFHDHEKRRGQADDEVDSNRHPIGFNTDIPSPS